MKVYIDGKILDKNDATISVLDHGLLYGDGLFEGIRIYGGRIFKLKEHLLRLYDGAKALSLKIPLTPEAMEQAVMETAAADSAENGYIRLVVTRGVGTLGLDPGRCPKPSIIIIVDTIQLYPAEYYNKGISVITSSIRKNTAGNVDDRIKSLNYLPNILATLEARKAGCLEALMLTQEGYVSECTADNIFCVKGGTLHTPPAYAGVLEGITRRTVLELAESAGFPASQTMLTCYDLYTADECFLTGTGAEIIPVVELDGRPIGAGTPGPVTQNLSALFKALVYG